MNEKDIQRIEKFAKKNNFDAINTDTALALIALQEYRKDIRTRVNELTYPNAVNKHRHVYNMLCQEFPSLSTEKILWALLRHGYISNKTSMVIVFLSGLIAFISMVVATNIIFENVFHPVYIVYILASIAIGGFLYAYLNGEL